MARTTQKMMSSSRNASLGSSEAQTREAVMMGTMDNRSVYDASADTSDDIHDVDDDVRAIALNDNNSSEEDYEEEGDGDYEIDTEAPQQQQHVVVVQRQQQHAAAAHAAFYPSHHHHPHMPPPILAHSHLSTHSTSSSHSSAGSGSGPSSAHPPGPQPLYHPQQTWHPDLQYHAQQHVASPSPSSSSSSFVGRPMYMAEHHLAPRPASAQSALYGPQPSSSAVVSDHHHMQHDAAAMMYAAHVHAQHFGPEAMSRSYSDPFAAATTANRQPVVAPTLSPETSFTVAPGSIGGGIDAVYRTPLAKGARGVKGGAVSSSPYTTDEPGSAQKYGSATSNGGDTPTFSHRSLTPASSSYSAGDSTYQPSNHLADSAERRKRDFAAVSPRDEDEDEFDEEHTGGGRRRYPQSSPLRGRKGRHGKQGATSLVPGKSSGKPRSSKKGGGIALSSKEATTTANVTTAKEDYIPEGVPPGPRSADKPHYSYAALIGQAINACPRRRLALSQIYAWISAAYPFFKKGDAGWMNSIRHNLSLNDCFVKNDRKTEDAAGKGSVWMIAEGCDYMFAGGGFKKTNRNNNNRVAAEDKKPSSSSSPHLETSTPVQVPAAHVVPPLSTSPLDGKKRKIGEVAIPFVPAYAPQQHFPPPPPPPQQQQQLHIYGQMPPPPPMIHAHTDADVKAMPPPPSRPPKRANTGPGIMEIDDPSSVDARHVAKLRQLPSSSPAQGCAPTSLRVVAREAGLYSSPALSHMQPSTLLQEAARKRTHDALMDDFTTPHRQIKVPRKDHTVGGDYEMPPHLTPSASSPVSSPAPQTIGRGGGDDVRTPVIIHDGSSDRDTIGRPPKAEPSSSVAALPKHHTHLLSSPTKESVTLSPIRRTTRNDTNGASLNLPGPDELLSKAKLPVSPRTAKLHRRLPSSDFLVSFGSPIRNGSKTNELFTTPLGKESNAASRLRSLNTPNTFSTPMRSSNGIHHIFNETPAGATKRQFMAEHGLLESPMGLSGSCYDIGNTEVQIDWAMEAFSNNGPNSPTRAGPHHHRRLPSQILSTPL